MDYIYGIWTSAKIKNIFHYAKFYLHELKYARASIFSQA